MQKLSKKLGTLEIAVSSLSLAYHIYFVVGILYAREIDAAEPLSSHDFTGQVILAFILFIFPSIILLIGSILHSKNRWEGGWIIFLILVPMLPAYSYLGFFGLVFGIRTFGQLVGLVVFVLIPYSMFVLAIAQATAISGLNQTSDPG